MMIVRPGAHAARLAAAVARCWPLACLFAIGATGLAAAPGASPAASSGARDQDPDARAARIEAQMTDDERIGLLSGIMPIPIPGITRTIPIPDGVPPTAGYVRGVPRLGVPDLLATDASLGVVNPFQLRPEGGATALPASLALASTFDPALATRAGAMIGREARARGFNVLLGGGVNLAFDPRNGRNFEYLGEDPLLAGRMVGAAIRGTQSVGVVSTIKHFALNAQETLRQSADARMEESGLREGELLAFQIGIETGEPGSVMCAYNLVNGAKACGNRWLLEDVLKRDWRYRGWVMSDWGAVEDSSFLLAGLDQQCGRELDQEPWFDGPLRERFARGEIPRARLSDAVRRILRSVYAVGADRPAPVAVAGSDAAAHAEVALEVARRGVVLLQNDGVLPLGAGVKSVLVVGDNADFGVLSGGGSSQVTPANGKPRIVEGSGDGPLSVFARRLYMPSSPLRELRAQLPGVRVDFDSGYSVGTAALRAARHDVAIVFVTRWEGETFDSASLDLPLGQDELVRAVAAANPRTVVVLQTGNAVALPWRERVGAILQAWYPGQEGGRAIAEIIAGKVNPSGRLPVSFPASLEHWPRRELPGLGLPARTAITVDYPEGSDIGYRRLARRGEAPLFAFGHGLGYTRFEYSGLRLVARDPVTLEFSVQNVGARAGEDVPQLYLVGREDERLQRLVGFERVALQPGESRKLRMTLDDRLLGEFEDGAWRRAAGRYRFAFGHSAVELGAPLEARLTARRRAP